MPRPLNRSPFVDNFDLDITLKDAALDETNSPTRRMLANAAIGVEPDDAYFSAVELKEAIEWLHEGVAGSKRKLAAILGNRCDDYQRCLYYILAGRGVVQMLDDLAWLTDVLKARGRMAGKLGRARRAPLPLASPYVAPQADGPVVSPHEEFNQGPSWWMDPV